MRIVNRLASTVLGIALIVGGLLLAAEAVTAALGRPPLLLPLRQWHTTLTTTTYANPGVLAVSVGVGLVGLVILVAQLRPWPADQVDLGVGSPRDGSPGGAGDGGTGGGSAGDGIPGDGGTRSNGASWRVQRRSVEHQVAHAVAEVPGVTAAAASVRGGHRGWRLIVRATARPDLLDEIRQSARTSLDRLAAPADVATKVDLRPPRRIT
jgi:hypothetical protein